MGNYLVSEYIDYQKKCIQFKVSNNNERKSLIEFYQKLIDKYGSNIRYISDKFIIVPDLISKCNKVKIDHINNQTMFVYAYHYDEYKVKITGSDVMYIFEVDYESNNITIKDYSKIFENTCVKNKDYWYKKIDKKIKLFLSKAMSNGMGLNKDSYNYENFMDTMIFI